MPNIEDLIDSGLDQQPTKFASAFNDIMGQKALEALDSMRTGIAQSIYAGEEEEDLEPEDQEDDLDSDIDDDEFDDVDDLDLEDEDLQFDDSDLEGLDDDGEDA
jgi:hypothetical protein